MIIYYSITYGCTSVLYLYIGIIFFYAGIFYVLIKVWNCKFKLIKTFQLRLSRLMNYQVKSISFYFT